MCKFWISKSHFIVAFLWISVINIKSAKSQVPFFFPMLESMNEIINDLPESHCKDDLKKYVEGIENHQEWALKMFDSSVKFPVGLLHGENYQLGNFDECVQTHLIASREGFGNTTHNIYRKEIVYGQYCLIEICSNETAHYKAMMNNDKPWYIRNQMHSIFWALCVPSSCNTSQALAFFENLFNESVPRNEFNVSLSPSRCYSEAETDLYAITAGRVLYCLVLAIFLLFVVGATIYDIFQQYKTHYHLSGYTVNEMKARKNLVHNAIIAFSILKNVKKLVQVRRKSTDLKLDCLCGIRSISMGFILTGHVLTFFFSSPMVNKSFRDEALQKVQNAIFLNNPLLVDTFLLISGFLVCCMLLAELDKTNGQCNVLFFYLSRLIRLTPSYLLVLMFYCTLLPAIGSGPFWKDRMQLEQERCIASWWANIFYINNYVNTDQICMFQSWYLSVDTQLFLISPAIIYPVWFKRVTGEVMLAMACLLTVILPLAITISNNLDPTLIMFPTEINDLSSNYYFKNYYVKTHMRANAYMVGLACGYIVHNMKSHKISFVVRILCGILAVVAGVGSMCSVLIFYQPDFEYGASEAGFYAVTHRLAWCFAIGWTVIICATTNSYVDNFLSWKVWAPFSKVSYSAYLVNGVVELYSYGTTRIPRYMSTFSLGCEALGHIIVTLCVAFAFCVLFELPIHNIEKLVMTKCKLNRQSTATRVDDALSEEPSFSRSLPDSQYSSSLHTMSVHDDNENNKTESS